MVGLLVDDAEELQHRARVEVGRGFQRRRRRALDGGQRDEQLPAHVVGELGPRPPAASRAGVGGVQARADAPDRRAEPGGAVPKRQVLSPQLVGHVRGNASPSVAARNTLGRRGRAGSGAARRRRESVSAQDPPPLLETDVEQPETEQSSMMVVSPVEAPAARGGSGAAHGRRGSIPARILLHAQRNAGPSSGTCEEDDSRTIDVYARRSTWLEVRSASRACLEILEGSRVRVKRRRRGAFTRSYRAVLLVLACPRRAIFDCTCQFRQVSQGVRCGKKSCRGETRSGR